MIIVSSMQVKYSTFKKKKMSSAFLWLIKAPILSVCRSDRIACSHFIYNFFPMKMGHGMYNGHFDLWMLGHKTPNFFKLDPLVLSVF